MSRHLKKLNELKQWILSPAQRVLGKLRGKKERSHSLFWKNGDRHHDQEEGSPRPVKKGILRVISRNYLFLAGAYLVTVVLLLSFFIWRLGNLSVEWPGGAEQEPYQQLITDENGGEQEQPIPLDAALEAGAEDEEPADEAAEDTDDYTRDFMQGIEEAVPADEWPAASREYLEQDEEENLLPRPASPLPGWSIHTPFGSYTHSVLATGRQVHGTARGVVLQGTPSAPVSTLWDGEVIQVSGQAGTGKNTVTIEHDYGYLSFYSRLDEVWVETGQFVSRGEHIGRLPESPYDSKAVMAPTPEKENDAAGPDEESTIPLQREDVRQLEPYEVQVNTVYSGSPEENGTAVSGGKTAAKSFPPAFQDGSPLLYLEVSYRKNHLDPVGLLLERN